MEDPDRESRIVDDKRAGDRGAVAGKGAQGPRIMEALRLAEEYLVKHGVESPRLSAEHLLAAVLGCTRLDLYLRFDELLDGDKLPPFRENLKKRASHFPLQYIIGEVEFCSMSFNVREGVFIPRPETELLVEWIEEIFPEDSRVRFLEFGVGTGVISGILAVRRPLWKGAAFDVSPSAAILARENLLSLGVADRIPVFVAEGFSSIDTRPFIDLLVANPPYIPTQGIPALQEEVSRYEERAALDGGDDGLRYYPVLAGAGAGMLRPGGMLAVEIGDGQAGRVEELLRDSGYDRISMRKDYNGMERTMIAFRPEAGR